MGQDVKPQYKIKTFNQISKKGLNYFNVDQYHVGSDIENPIAYLLRSHKLHDQVVSDDLCAVARAGAGVNNIPIEDYSEKGIVVFNTPGANANAVKELVLAGMLLGSRGICQGMDYVKTLNTMTDAAEMSALLEKEKKRFAGRELFGKTLGVVGLGAIGSLVAYTALSLGMKVVGYDPALSVEAAWRLPSDVQRMEDLNALMAQSDFITLHVPAIAPTKHMINADRLGSVKPGAVLLNFARESIVDSSAVIQSLDDKKLGQYICDFPEPALIGRSDVLAMPHIGASTAESEENCAVMAVNQLKDYLENGNITNSVNFPRIQLDRNEGIRLTLSNKNVSGALSDVLNILAKHELNVVDLVNKSQGELAYNILDLEGMPSEQALSEIKALSHVIRIRVIG